MSSPFDLEKAIAAWRRPFEHNTAFSSEDLEELESSLRSRVDALLVAARRRKKPLRLPCDGWALLLHSGQWRRLNGHQLVIEVVTGTRYVDGVEQEIERMAA